MRNPLPPSQRQANEAQQARLAAEIAVLSLFVSSETGGGTGEDESSALRSVEIASILAALSSAIVFTSFRSPRDRSKSLLLVKPDHEKIVEDVLPSATDVFNDLLSSELDDEQRAVVWATRAYSDTADAIADAVNRGDIQHVFSGSDLVLKKVWISRSDRRVRPLHAKLHGRTIPTSEDFWRWPHTGQRLRWPGDKDAPLDSTIGCRCVSILTWSTQDAVSSKIHKIVEATAPR